MREIDADEIQKVFSQCGECIDKMNADYKKMKGISDFKPAIKFYPIGVTGFLVLFKDNSEATLASILNADGNMIFTSYSLESGRMN